MPETKITDETLMTAIGNNDYISYNKLFDRYYTRLCQYVYAILQDKNDTEDMVQEVFLNLWYHRQKIVIKENVSGYLYQMAKNLALNHIRSKSHLNILTNNEEQLTLSYEETPLETQEFRIALYDCINRLPSRSREVLLLHRIKGLKQKEISEKLDISVKTIKNQIWTSLQKLKKCLELKEM